jgi:hypothetical protein
MIRWREPMIPTYWVFIALLSGIGIGWGLTDVIIPAIRELLR